MRVFGRCVLIMCGICAVPWPLQTQSLLAFSDERGPHTLRRTITFAERVAYQHGIEQVYWRHRIWPKDNPGPKPPFNVIISREQIERKVEDCLRKSQAVADQRGWAITATELQAEMDRMARDTKQPVVLHELFAALANDPFVIAECLARPILAGRFAGELAKDAGVEASVSNAVTFAPASQAYRLPEILGDCTDDTWTAITAVNAPQARSVRRAVWTGSEMIIWGGSNGTGLNTGGRYNPSTDTWTATSTTNAPTGRGSHTLVWTGIEVIVWGGYIQLVGDTNTGGRYNPSTDSWIVTSTVNAPHARDSHTAVWTGNEMIVWGGFSDPGVWFNSGGRYNPATDSWIVTSTLAAPERRWDHTAEWTGNEMIVWGGTNQTIALNTGGKYNPATDSWTPTNTANAPLGRVAHTSIWSGSEMDVWGGYDSTITDFNTGGRYNPTTDSWAAISTLNAPSPRDYHTAVWTGTEMIIWGGELITQPVSFDTGGRYDPATDGWRATGITNVPHARNDHTAVWAGDKMIVWGGSYWMGGNRLYLNTGGTYCAQPSTQLQGVVSRKNHGFAGDFGVNLPLDGTPAIECRSGGATNDYTIVLTFTANVTVNGNPQAAVTSGIGTIGSGGVSNGGRAIVAGNLVTIPLTNVANAQTIQVTLYGVYGSTNVVIPMSILVGDTNGNGAVNASDVSQTKSRVGQQISPINFRADVNADGYIDAADIALVKSRVGTAMP